ncbi:hypothetical protein [Actinomadura flavalba]|uniref:hypothetical protein n=1 Tax=Actinomadura flavalba TaxID=1120938 RepID=UPI00036685FD|nr:hypothetical protein [Actinomadura flavalba]
MQTTRFRASAALLAATTLTLVTGCSLLGGSNTAEVCAEARTAYARYMTQIQAVPANVPAQWKAPTDALAAKLDGLAAKADDATLKKTLKSESTTLRAAVTPLTTGDTTQLTKSTAATPRNLGRACD